MKQSAPNIAQAWIQYQDRYAYLAEFFQQSELYSHQVSKAAGTVGKKRSRYPLDRSMLFVERCFNLLADKGICGLVVPKEIAEGDGVRSLLKDSFMPDSAHDVMTPAKTDETIATLCWIKQRDISSN